ncbi:hypothetical protein [Paraburkholderia tropica]|uniref:hypothetical protein n=1 Tax=Paraburkholderia tropica TaxID=92647 RepID=UPI002AB6638B|nr:hypothetical protein [Paraburkholderia tropica]
MNTLTGTTEKVRDAMLEEALGELITLSKGVEELKTSLGSAVRAAREDIEKGGELAALRVANLLDDRTGRLVQATKEIGALRELLVGEIAAATHADSIRLFREEVARAVVEKAATRRRDIWISALIASGVSVVISVAIFIALRALH